MSHFDVARHEKILEWLNSIKDKHPDETMEVAGYIGALEGERTRLGLEYKAFKEEERDRCLFWEKQASEYKDASDYYQTQLVDAHALLGRVLHQLSERWDRVNLTQYFPTDNLHHHRNIGNARGKKKE